MRSASESVGESEREMASHPFLEHGGVSMDKNKVVPSGREVKLTSQFLHRYRSGDPREVHGYPGLRNALSIINIIYNKPKGLGMEVIAKGATRSTPHP